jgi:D-alanyl-D-alanine carboxypeptidase
MQQIQYRQRKDTRRKRKAKQKEAALRACLLLAVTATVIGVLIFSIVHRSEAAAATEKIAEETTALKEGWERKTMTQQDLQKGDLVLVNSEHSYEPENASALVGLYDNKAESYYVKDKELQVSLRIVQPLNDWLNAFENAKKINNINIVAGFRTKEYQQMLRNNAIETHDLDYANQYIALPGCSEHHTGLAVDFDSYYEDSGLSGGFDGNGDYQWLIKNAWNYGFIQRYPSGKQSITGIAYETWHFRYVGLPHAKVMSEQNLCLEEYIDYVKKFPYDGTHLTVECNSKSYEIYYCAGFDVTVPTDREYDISGNNVDGFIITITNP